MAAELYTKAQVDVDPITLRVITGTLETIMSEMGSTIFRMAYSNVVSEAEDLGCALVEPDGGELVESDNSPLHMGSIGFMVSHCMETTGGVVEEGDVLIHNHPYKGSPHTPDVMLATPVFFDGKLIAFSGATSHWLDLGGAAPGINVDVVDMWAEAKVFDALKLYQRGERNEELWRMIFENTRTQTANEGDCEALIAAIQLGRRRFSETLERYGPDVVLSACDLSRAHAEKLVRNAIRKVPDGSYYAEGWLDNDGRTLDKPLKVATTVVVEGDSITFDMTGSADEVPTGFNVPFEGALVVAMYSLGRKLFLDPVVIGEEVPYNDGSFRPFTVVAPLGSIFNPRFPRASFSRFSQVQRAADNAILALADVMPEQVTAGNSAHLHFFSFSGFDAETQQYWLHLDIDTEGAYGGRAKSDGPDCVANLIANPKNSPIEEMEWHRPLRCERYELRDEPPGAGRTRGGIGIVRRVKLLDGGYVSCEGDRHYEAPRGLFGGLDGRTGRVVRNPGTDQEREMPSKFTAEWYEPGETNEVHTPCAAGYGPPYERDADLVREDVLDGYLDAETALRDYGVVLERNAEGRLEVNGSATQARRAEPKQSVEPPD